MTGGNGTPDQSCPPGIDADLATTRWKEELIEGSDYAIYRVDFVRGGYDYISPQALDRFGLGVEVTQHGGLAVLLEQLLEPDERERITEEVRALCRASPGQTLRARFDYRLKNAQGETVWHENSMTLVAAADGTPLRASGISVDITDRHRIEESLRAKERELSDLSRRNAILFEGAMAAIVIIDADSGLIVDLNVAAETLFARPHEEMIGLHQSLLWPPAADVLARPIGEHRDAAEEAEIITADGHQVAVDVTSNVFETMAGQRFVQCVFRDIRQQKQDEIALKRAALVFESSQEAILMTDADGKVISTNQMFAEITGYSAAEIIGQKPSLLSSGRHTPEFYAAMWESIHTTGRWQGEIWDRRKNGDVFPVWLTISAYRDAQGKVLNYVGVASDISEHVAAQEHIRKLAFFDPLTELPNRRLLQDRAGQSLAVAERERKNLALLFVDLDHFKMINDSLGHSIGDQLLLEVARRLQSCVRRMDTVARLGGDEFVVLLPEVTVEGATEVARKLIYRISRGYQVDNHELSVTPSIGISVFPQDGDDFETLLKHADTAMYRAKESGRSCYQFFTSEMNTAVLERLMLENSLRQGIERGEFVLHYQPQIDLETGRIVGAEALVRWRHLQLGLVPPGKFIPVAEVSGLIVTIGEWVLGEACRQNKAWQDAGLPAVTVAVNISAVQFLGRQIEESVRACLEESGLEPHYLELELTEGIVMGGANETVETLQRLSDLGISLAIDDFGTGYSSLSYLKRFPIDRLKIDQSFVRDLVSDPDDWAISSAIINLGHSLRLRVIAEGVEHPEQLDILKRQGCNEVQGYLFSVPLPADGLAKLLADQQSLIAKVRGE